MAATSGAFAIVMPSLTVTGPAAGAAFYAGTPLTITWSTNLPGGSPVVVELSRDGGGTFETLAAAAPNTGSFAWVGHRPRRGGRDRAGDGDRSRRAEQHERHVRDRDARR